ncbi:MAG: hypothetical protein U9R42_03350 [Bacteroidota bacterium]|nr:hypothetical protein [Bacteroidota bacterium]
MNFREIKVGELQAFVNSGDFLNNNIIPISSHRAISQSLNPSADKNDTALIVAYKNEILVGYIGLLPDTIRTNKKQKIFWNSCWWVDQEKGKQIAMPLFYKAMESSKKNILLTDLSPHTLNILKKTSLFYFSNSIIGTRAFLRFDFQNILPQKKIFFSKIKFVLKILDFNFNLVTAPKRIFVKQKIKKYNFNFQKIEFVDEEANNFIKKNNKSELIKREKKELNWIIKNKWILPEDKDKNKEKEKYFFSSFSNNFEYLLYKLYDKNDKLIAFLMLKSYNGNLIIPYCYFEKENAELIQNFITKIALQKKIKSITTFNPVLSKKFFKNKSRFIFVKKLTKDFAISNELEHCKAENYNLQDGDGDGVFA